MSDALDRILLAAQGSSSDDVLELTRRVASAEGAKRYNKPIGSPLNGTGGRGPSLPGGGGMPGRGPQAAARSRDQAATASQGGRRTPLRQQIAQRDAAAARPSMADQIRAEEASRLQSARGDSKPKGMSASIGDPEKGPQKLSEPKSKAPDPIARAKKAKGVASGNRGAELRRASGEGPKNFSQASDDESYKKNGTVDFEAEPRPGSPAARAKAALKPGTIKESADARQAKNDAYDKKNSDQRASSASGMAGLAESINGISDDDLGAALQGSGANIEGAKRSLAEAKTRLDELKGKTTFTAADENKLRGAADRLSFLSKASGKVGEKVKAAQKDLNIAIKAATARPGDDEFGRPPRWATEG